jgi:hypothetical protein
MRLIFLAAALVCAIAQDVMAEWVVTIDDVTVDVSRGEPVRANVWIEASPDESRPLAAFQLEFQIAGDSLGTLQITSTGLPNGLPYLFEAAQTSPAGLVSDDGRSILVGDFLETGWVEPGGPRGLFAVDIDVPADVPPAQYALSINPDPSTSFLATSSSQFIGFRLDDGMLTVVPEPAGFYCAVIAALLFVRRRLR